MSGLNLFDSITLLWLLVALCLALSAFFAAGETALISCDRSWLRRMARDGSQSAAIAHQLIKNIESLVTTTQLGMNLAIGAATTLATIISFQLSEQNAWWVVPILTPVVLLLCDTLPKVLARAHAETTALYLARPIYIARSMFQPITRILSIYTNRLTNLIGGPRPGSLTMRKRVRKQILSLLSDRSVASGIKINQRRMIRNILNFTNQTVRKAMIPLVNVDAIASDASVEDALHLFETLRHSRIPVYEERVDNVVGVLHFMDLFAVEDLKKPVTLFMRPAMYASEHQQLEALIVEMNSRQDYIAIVVDEYGGATGLITEEDVLEEVVGNLSDEFDENQRHLHQITENSYLANVSIELNELNERLNVTLPKGDYETLAGFLLQQFNRIPVVGDELYYANLKFLVYRANEKAIHSVVITRQKSTKAKSK